MRVENPHCLLFQYFNNSRKNNGYAFSVTFAPRLYNHSHQPGLHMLPTWPLALLQVLQNSGSQLFITRVRPCQCDIATDSVAKSKKKKNCKECSNIKLKCQCTDWLSATSGISTVVRGKRSK